MPALAMTTKPQAVFDRSAQAPGDPGPPDLFGQHHLDKTRILGRPRPRLRIARSSPTLALSTYRPSAETIFCRHTPDVALLRTSTVGPQRGQRDRAQIVPVESA